MLIIPAGLFKKREHVRERGAHVTTHKHRPTNTKEAYEQVRNLGEGGQGKVCVVRRKSDGKLLVRKEQQVYSTFGDMPVEMHILEKVLGHHPRIVEFYSGNFLKANMNLVMYFEYCQGGDLHDFIPRPGDKGCSETFLWHCFIQLAEALAFLHFGIRSWAKDPDLPPRGWARVVHRDIKPANVFIRRKMTTSHPIPEIVLGDFGLATLMFETYGSGTTEWCGPEIPVVTRQGDVWGAGAIIHALAHGRGPVPSPPRDWPRGRDATEMWYANPKARQPKQLPTSYSSALNRNMMDCLVRDPNKRVESRDLLDHLKAERPRPRRR